MADDMSKMKEGVVEATPSEFFKPYLYYVRLRTGSQIFDNVGDYLGKVLFESFCGGVMAIRVNERHPDRFYSVVGSVIETICAGRCNVWGAGLHYGDSSPKISKECHFFAVRGPLTSQKLDLLKKPVGDPALLMPAVYHRTPSISGCNSNLIGLVPHFRDANIVSALLLAQKNRQDFIQIDTLTSNYESFIDKIRGCKLVLSSSLHGVILAHAYDVPAIWCKFSNLVPGGGFKFMDYFLSVSIPAQCQLDLTNIGSDSLRYVVNYAVRNKFLTQIVNFDPRPLIESCPFATDDKKNSLLSYFRSSPQAEWMS